ncbi:MAG TPA: M56 family metallopeptidase, partial [Vicinamibacterales bacterium]|nr:M56 family metallopeptidase [Vicinamibacterales bacterium]
AFQSSAGAAPAVECRAHDRVTSPLTVGWQRPQILLPVSWRQWPPERLAIILRHELAHVERRDYLWNLIAAIAETALWFVPGLRLAAARMRLAAELAADDAASVGVGRVTYAQHLVETAAGIRGGGRLAAFTLAPGVASSLRRRVDALLEPGDQPPAANRFLRAAALVAVAIVVLTLVSLRAAGPDFNHAQEHRANHHNTHSLHLR